MLSVFGLTFFAVYVVLKWRYVVPTVYGDSSINWSVWPYSIATAGIGVAQLVLEFPRVSLSAAYAQLLLAVYSIASPASGAWKSCIVALILSSAHIFRNGETNEVVPVLLLMLLVAKYFHHTRHMLPQN